MIDVASIDWTAQPLGQITDAALAARLGVRTSVVAQARRSLGILGHRDRPVALSATRGAGGIDWSVQPLGQMSDRDLAQRLGIKTSWVALVRRWRGIPVFVAREDVLSTGGLDRAARWYSYPIDVEVCRYCAEAVQRGSLRARDRIVRWTDQGPCCADHYGSLPECSHCSAPVSSEGDMCDACITRLIKAEHEAGHWRCDAPRTVCAVSQGDIEGVRRGLTAFESKRRSKENRENKGDKR
jgi:hypothetical protein